MALGKYARIDAHNTSRYCMTMVLVMFISTCLLAAWMGLSTSIRPLGLGLRLQQFMGGMPKKANLTDADLHEDHPFKVNDSQDVVQDHTNLIMQGNVPKDPQSSHVAQNNDIAPNVAAKSFSLNGEENKGWQDKNRGPPEEDKINQEVHSEKHVDNFVQVQTPDITEKHVAETSFTLNGEENKASQEKNSGSPEEVDNSNREVPHEKYVDSAVQPLDNDGQTVANRTKQVGDIKTKVEETNKEYTKSIPFAWINANAMHDEMFNQTKKPTQEQSETSFQVPSSSSHQSNYNWKVCNVTAGPDYIPCLDNIQAIKKLRSTGHYEHRERHCPDDAPICLVPLPKGYKTPIKWAQSRDMIWFSNVPHTRLVEYKGGQNWVKVFDRYLTFPGGGTQFTFGALHYIDYLEQSVPDIALGRRSRVVLDVGCGVASFGGYLFERDVLTMSLAPKDEHEAQVQFALERGIPAISAVMGTTRLPFPSMVFDVIHCARCRVPWHVEGGKLLLELNRLLRPGGYFIWSATPVYRKDPVNAAIWKDTSDLTKSICWELVKVERDTVNRKAAAIFRKPVTNDCYEGRQKNDPPFCEDSDDPSKAWYTPLQSCIHKAPTSPSERGSQWPPLWPSRLDNTPYWLKTRDFSDDNSHWKNVIATTYLNGSGIDWSSVRNVMDMNASYGGFGAALKDLKVWVMNVVPVNSSDTLPIIYERGLFGMYHDWCESFSTYPRSYDLLHANHLFSGLKKRCSLTVVMAEVDRMLRPGSWLIVRDDTETVSEVQNMANSLHWNIKFAHSQDKEQVFCFEKTMWRPSEVETISAAIG